MYIELKNITKTFGDFVAAKDINFGVEEGKMVAFLGPSGSGKTTILRMIAGLEQQDCGDVIINGKVVNDVPAGERGIGFVFQNYALFRYMNVYENIAFGLRVQKKSNAEIKTRVTELINLVGLDGLEKRYPNQLSGGQRQRVAFARAIAPNPSLLLLDEPFAAIDAKIRKELRGWLKRMIARVGITSIFVTHDQDEALEVADEILLINEGKIEQMGAPLEIYKNPKTPFVAQFVGTSTSFNGVNRLKGFEHLSADKPAIIRPEFTEAFKSDNEKFKSLIPDSESGRITDISFRGSYMELTLDIGGIEVTTNRALERRPVQVGESMNVLIYRACVLDGENTCIYENSRLAGVDIEAL